MFSASLPSSSSLRRSAAYSWPRSRRSCRRSHRRRHRRRAAGDGLAPGNRRRPAGRRIPLAAFRRQLQQPPPQPADADHARERQPPRPAVDVPDGDARQLPDDVAPSRQHPLRDRPAERRVGARRPDGTADLALPPRAAERPHRVLRPGQSRVRRARRQAVHDDARRAPARARHEDRRRRLGRRDGGLQEGLCRDHRPARRQGQGDRRIGRRRVRVPLLHRRVRRATPGSAPGASSRFPALASRATTRGPAIRGRAADRASG